MVERNLAKVEVAGSKPVSRSILPPSKRTRRAALIEGLLMDPEAVPRPVAEAGPARRLRDAIEPIATHAFWNLLTNEHNRDRGLGRRPGYVWGRAAALGEPSAAVVVSAFAWFEPEALSAAYELGRSKVPRAEMLQARDRTTAESLGSILGDADLEPAVAVLRRGLEAADGTGRALFAGLRSRSWPEDPAGRLWRACDLLREHRGDSHIAACIAAGFGPVEMNILTELWVGMPQTTYTATRSWTEARMEATVAGLEAQGLVAEGSLTLAGRTVRERIEEQTDLMEQPIVAALGGDYRALVAQLDNWSQTVIDAGGFPADPLKRAAG